MSENERTHVLLPADLPCSELLWRLERQLGAGEIVVLEASAVTVRSALALSPLFPFRLAVRGYMCFHIISLILSVVVLVVLIRLKVFFLL